MIAPVLGKKYSPVKRYSRYAFGSIEMEKTREVYGANVLFCRLLIHTHSLCSNSLSMPSVCLVLMLTRPARVLHWVRFLQPTHFRHVNPDSRCSHHLCFNPVLVTSALKHGADKQGEGPLVLNHKSYGSLFTIYNCNSSQGVNTVLICSVSLQIL